MNSAKPNGKSISVQADHHGAIQIAQRADLY
jgi:hypothetical protein